MLHYVKGNLLESNAQALVNTVNTVGVMGKGIALQFREAFRENYRIYRNMCQEKKLNVGKILVVEDTNLKYGKKIIFNFPTKTHWRLPSEYAYIAQGLQSLRTEIIKHNIRSIAIPPLGSHNGGLEWLRVKPMIEQALSDLDCDIYIYEPSDIIIEKLKSERVKLTPARAMLLTLLSDMNKFGEFASVFAAEKVIYFMQCFGAEHIFKIEYQPYHYGPYSDGKVAHMLYALNGSYIKGMGGMDNRPFDYIWLLNDTDSVASSYLADTTDSLHLSAICNKTKAFLRGFYSNYSLELLSSVHYLLKHTTSLQNWRNDDETVVLDRLTEEIQRWSNRKQQLFKRNHLSLAYQHLKNSEIL